MDQQGKTTAKSAARSVVIDLLAIVGLGLVGYGSFLIYEPASYLILGTILMSASFFARR